MIFSARAQNYPVAALGAIGGNALASTMQPRIVAPD
jgi:hypothetical protein